MTKESRGLRQQSFRDGAFPSSLGPLRYVDLSDATDDRPPETGWLADTPIGDNLLRQFLHNQADACDVIAGHFGGAVARKIFRQAMYQITRRSL